MACVPGETSASCPAANGTSAQAIKLENKRRRRRRRSVPLPACCSSNKDAAAGVDATKRSTQVQALAAVEHRRLFVLICIALCICLLALFS